MKTIQSVFVLLTLFLTISCSNQEDLPNDNLEAANFSLLDYLAKDNVTNKRDRPMILVDCDKFTGIVVPATFKPKSDPFDELYVMPDGAFAYGAPLISDSKPGDKDYNGGRWHLNVLKSDVDPAKYMDACSEEDLDLEDFMSTDNYFGCPLKPFK